MTENKILALLSDFGICDEDSIDQYYPRVRDRDDVSVMRCRKSGVIFLSRSDHMDISHYENKEDFSWAAAVSDLKSAALSGLEDNHRRAAQFQTEIRNRRWLDVGTGPGGILDLLASVSSEAQAVEPQTVAREELLKRGYNVHASVSGVRNEYAEVVTLFHVFEHFTEPVDTLRTIRSKMIDGARIIIEVPHANDFLISFLDLDRFKAFTFWSEHLILHTRQSLTAFLEHAGFKDISVRGFQRYPLANHLYWLAKSEPGGHQKWSHLRTPELDSAYAQLLDSLDQTDTLMATAVK
jgi:Methyltransferase domain